MRKLYWALVIFVIASLLDFGITFNGVYFGKGDELNPIINLFIHPHLPFLPSLYVFSVLAFTLSIIGVFLLKLASDAIHNIPKQKQWMVHYNLPNLLIFVSFGHLIGFSSWIIVGAV